VKEMVEKYKINPCGLSCEFCDSNTTKLQDSADYLSKASEDPMFFGIMSTTNPGFNTENIPGFKEIIKTIGGLPPCPGCDESSHCSISQCAKEKKVENCGKCDNFDVEKGNCTAPPTASVVPMTPPAPIYLGFLGQRYQDTNIKNLQAIAKGNMKEVESWIDDMVKNKKTNRDLIDTSVNLFDMMKK
jgi:hypothetical protein